ncbi:hypothetical protein JB92DRAFT_2696284 [Gautieria morchelliformis]|nr:hypothetical protein JB92DRAFT_2696284 [Gautieria morchelliformis]
MYHLNNTPRPLSLRCPTTRTRKFSAASQSSCSVSVSRFVTLSTLCVGTGTGGSTNMLARVTITDFQGQTLMDTYVLPTMPVVDYRTASTGIDANALSANSACNFSKAQRYVAELIRGRIVIGYCLWSYVSFYLVLGITHPAAMTRDVALFMPFRAAIGKPKQMFGLPTLMHHLMRRQIQMGRLDSLENGRAALDLYRSHSVCWEAAMLAGQWPCALPPSTFSRCYL